MVGVKVAKVRMFSVAWVDRSRQPGRREGLRGSSRMWTRRPPFSIPSLHTKIGLKKVVYEVPRHTNDFLVSASPSVHSILTLDVQKSHAPGRRQGLCSCGRVVQSGLYGGSAILLVDRYSTGRDSAVRVAHVHGSLGHASITQKVRSLDPAVASAGHQHLICRRPCPEALARPAPSPRTSKSAGDKEGACLAGKSQGPS
jgi:hypothetical protein